MKFIFCLVFVFSAFISQAQVPHVDKVSGFSVYMPESWEGRKPKKGEFVFHSNNLEQTATYDVQVKTLKAGTSAEDCMAKIESELINEGWSDNYMQESKKSISGAVAVLYNADEVYGGTFSRTIRGVETVKVIFVYRKVQKAFITIQTCKKEEQGDLVPVYDIFYSTFRLL
jgi:hypothetical protein